MSSGHGVMKPQKEGNDEVDRIDEIDGKKPRCPVDLNTDTRTDTDLHGQTQTSTDDP